MTAVKIIAATALLMLAIITYACCMAASASDKDADRIYREYIKWKRKKEKKHTEK